MKHRAKTRMPRSMKRKHSVIISYVLPLVISALLLGAFYIFRENSKFAVSIIDNFSFPIRKFLGNVFSHVPFSAMEVVYTFLGLLLIIFVLRTIWFIFRRHNGRLLIKRFFCLFLAAAYIWTGYCYLWGIDYYGPSFVEKSGFSVKPVTSDALISVTTLFLGQANALSSQVSRDDEGQFSADLDQIFEDGLTVYDNLEEEFAYLNGTSLPLKSMVYSVIMSRMGYTGIYFPFTGESNINIDAPMCLIPATVSHELAHQRGIYSEQEANFLGILAGIKSDNTVYQYSGYLSGLIYLMNALNETDYEAWLLLRQSFSEELETDWTYNNDYWDSMQSSITTASDKIYDSFLKSNGQTLGILSYSACVTLIVSYYA